MPKKSHVKSKKGEGKAKEGRLCTLEAFEFAFLEEELERYEYPKILISPASTRGWIRCQPRYGCDDDCSD